jgi:hypothetical protein
MGPIGSGKTSVGLQRGVIHCLGVLPERDGVRRAHFAVIRRTYVDLWRTTIPSWSTWYPRTSGVWTGGVGGPATHDLVLRHPDGGLLKLRVSFLAFGDLALEEALRGLEITCAFVDEADGVDDRALPWLFGRCGRYRLNHQVAPQPKAVWGSTNPPDVEHWIFRDTVEKPRPGLRLYRQPGGMSPGAENLAVLGPDYYPGQLRVLDEWDARRLVHAEFGFSRTGKPVFPEFNTGLHVATALLAADPALPLMVGLDAGGTPAAVVAQAMPNGQRRYLAELVTANDAVTGPTRFGEALRDLLATDFRGCKVHGVADPSAAFGADKEAGEASWIETVSRVAKIPVRPAPTNGLHPRLEALRLPMTRLIDGRHPQLLIAPGCRTLIRGLASAYRYRKIAGAAGRFTDQPEKNEVSHVIDAAQYAALDQGGYAATLARPALADLPPIRGITDFNPFALETT